MATKYIDFSAYLRQKLAMGRVVKLNDGRIGMIEAVETNTLGAVTTERGYVVGIEKEFAVWASRLEIARWYGEVEAVATSATEAAPVA